MNLDQNSHYSKTWAEIEAWYERSKQYDSGYNSMLQFVKEIRKNEGIDHLITSGEVGCVIIYDPDDSKEYGRMRIMGADHEVAVAWDENGKCIEKLWEPMEAAKQFLRILSEQNW